MWSPQTSNYEGDSVTIHRLYWVTMRPIIDVRAPVHLVTGSAGCREGRDHFRHNSAKWSAFRSQDYGYTKLKAYKKGPIYIEQVSADLEGKVIDSFWLVKTT